MSLWLRSWLHGERTQAKQVALGQSETRVKCRRFQTKQRTHCTIMRDHNVIWPAICMQKMEVPVSRVFDGTSQGTDLKTRHAIADIGEQASRMAQDEEVLR